MNTLRKKPVSEARLRANRANAQKSTGPRTPEGKLRSSLNALKHGLTARDLTALGEHYDSLPETIQAFRDAWQPRDLYEASLVDQLAVLKVRLDRCTRMETGLLDNGIPRITPETSHESVNSAIGAAFTYKAKDLTLLNRYESNLSRAYERTFKQLQSLQNDRPCPSAPPTIVSSETDPISVENKVPAPSNEPSSEAPPASVVAIDHRRLDLESPTTPADALSRRHGQAEPLPPRHRRQVVLQWEPAK